MPALLGLVVSLLACRMLGAVPPPPRGFSSSTSTSCGGGEWKCGGGDGPGKCITLNKFCDGIENCEDGSDEPLGCTNCNRTFYGEANVKYPLRVTGPFQRYLPFVCKIDFVAAGKEFGDFVELTFLSFQIGRLELTRNQTAVCQKGHLKISEWPEEVKETEDNPSELFRPAGRFSSPSLPKSHQDETLALVSVPEFGEFCGSMIERSVTFFSQSSNVSVTAVVPSRASIPSTSFGLYLTYRFLKRKHLPEEAGVPIYLGDPVPGTYCDRHFTDCHGRRRCRIRTPNFPGFYPRNITCQFFVRQPKAPEGYISRIVLSQPNDYKISVPTGRTTSTTGTSFLLSTDCISGDSVRIYDGPSVRSPQLLEFCGSGSLPEIVASGNELLVQIRSAPYQHLSNSRVELQVSIRFEMVQSESLQGDAGRCSYTLDGTRRRWGLIHSPRHTMPPNANCTYRLIGASRHDRIWLYFVSFFVLVEKRPTSLEFENSCAVSKLEIYDFGSGGSNGSSGSSLVPEPTHLFCGESGPRICAHAADYPPRYLPPRPCEVPGESYLSTSSELVIRHRFLSFASELLSSSTSSFTARYEFVDTSQHGTPIDHSPCDRRLDSRLAQRGTLSNPRNVFFYGRGGRHNLTCMFHFVGLPSERVRLSVRRLGLRSQASGCRPHFDTVLQKHDCRLMQGHGRPWALLGATEYWGGHSSPVGCVCDVSLDREQPPLVLESLVGNVKLEFEVRGMSHLEDFEDYFFEVDYEFVNSTTCESGLRRHVGLSGDGALSFRAPPKTLFYEVPSKARTRILRCRWQIEASPHKYLYLKFRGVNASSIPECRFGSRLLVYLDPRAKPIANACVDEDRLSQRHPDDPVVEFDVFSHTWYNESRHHDSGDPSAPSAKRGDPRDRLFIEMVAPAPQAASFLVQWLEVTRPFVRTQSGQTLRNVECLFECPEIGACIDPELWCDGAVHCPSGFDESPEHCRHFPVTYVSCSAAGVLVCLALVVWFTVRRRRVRKRLKKKDIRRIPQDDFCVESPVG